jgi:hypothetical protein
MPQYQHVLQSFAYAHLPAHVQVVVKPFAELAHALVWGDNTPESGNVTLGGPLPRNAELTETLLRLLEARDAAVRCILAGRTSSAPSAQAEPICTPAQIANGDCPR